MYMFQNSFHLEVRLMEPNISLSSTHYEGSAVVQTHVTIPKTPLHSILLYLEKR